MRVRACLPAGRLHTYDSTTDGKLAAASNVGADTITLIDIAKKAPLQTITTGDGAAMSLFSADGSKLYVANLRAANVSVIDVASGQVIKTLPGGKGVMAFVPVAGWSEAWLTAPAEDKLVLLDLIKDVKIADVALPGEPHGMVLSPDGKTIYVVQRKLDQIAKVDVATRRIVKTGPVGKRPDMIAISPDGDSLFVVSRDEDKLYRVSAADLSVQGEVTTGDEPHGVAYRP